MGDHPLASQNTYLYEHRKVLYDRIGAGPHCCHWCGCEVVWRARGKKKLVADHLDNDKLNNHPDNLVPSCHACNGTRGMFMAWVIKHRDDPFLRALFQRARSGSDSAQGLLI